MSPELVGGLAGTLGTLLVILLKWWLDRPKRAADEERAQTKIATQLRDELRRDNESLRKSNDELRERQRETEKSLAATIARLEDMRRDNDVLRRENFDLKGVSGEQAEQLRSQAEEIKILKMQVAEYQADRLLLIDAMRKANIPIPPLTKDRPIGGD